MTISAPALVRVPTPEAVANTVADRLLTLLTARTATMQEVHIVLTGGTVAALVHRRSATLAVHRGGAIRWPAVHLWWGDERWLAHGDPERNDYQARHDLLGALPLPQANLHPFPAASTAADAEDPDAVAAAAQTFAAELVLRGPAVFDLVMLGAGPDGHVASLFPGHTSQPAGPDVASVLQAPKPPSARLTMTQERLARTSELWAFATGPAKAEALAAAHDGADLPLHTVTAAALEQGATVTWFLDDAAGSLLME